MTGWIPPNTSLFIRLHNSFVPLGANLSSLTLMRGLCVWDTHKKKLQGNNEAPPPLQPPNPFNVQPHGRGSSALPFPKCALWSLGAQKVPVYGARGVYTWKKKNPISAFKNEISLPHPKKKKRTMQTSPLCSGHSINLLWNKSWRARTKSNGRAMKGS